MLPSPFSAQHTLVFLNKPISSPSEAASVRSVEEEAGSSVLEILDSTPEDPGKSCGTDPRDEASALGACEPEILPSDVKELQSPETITEINSTVTDSPLNPCVSTRTEENPSAHLQTTVHQPDASPSLPDPLHLNHNADNIRSMDDDDDDSAPVNATDPLNADTDPKASSECDENKDKCVGDPLQSSNESTGNCVETHDDVDEAPPTPPVGPAPRKTENKKHFFQRNKKSSNEGNLFMCLIKVVFFSTAA